MDPLITKYVTRTTKNAKFISERIYLGQVNISADIIIIGSVMDTKNGLTPISKRLLAKIIKEKSKNTRFCNRKTYCHSFPKIILEIAIKSTGTI